MLSTLFDMLREIEPVVSAIAALMTVGAMIWGVLKLRVLARRFSYGETAEPGAAAGDGTSNAAAMQPLRALFNLGLSKHSRLEELVSVRTINVGLFCILGLSFSWLLICFAVDGLAPLIVLNLLVFTVALLGFVLQWSDNTKLARWMLLGAAVIYWLGCLLAVGPHAGTEYFLAALLMLPVLTFSRSEVRSLALAVSLILALFAIGVFASRLTPPLVTLAEPVASAGYFANALLLAVVMYVSVRFYRNFAATSYHQLESKTRQHGELAESFIPSRLSRQLEQQDGVVAEWHPDASLLVASIEGFSELYQRMSAREAVRRLSEIYTEFDSAVLRLGLDKVKSLGGTYVAAAGLGPDTEGPEQIARLALAFRTAIVEFAQAHDLPLGCRCGIASGLAASGVIAGAMPRFDVWGSALDDAMRIHSHARGGDIFLNAAASTRLNGLFLIEAVDTAESTYRLLGARTHEPR